MRADGRLQKVIPSCTQDCFLGIKSSHLNGEEIESNMRRLNSLRLGGIQTAVTDLHGEGAVKPRKLKPWKATAL